MERKAIVLIRPAYFFQSKTPGGGKKIIYLGFLPACLATLFIGLILLIVVRKLSPELLERIIIECEHDSHEN